jgi:hypothetical protein
MIVLRRVHGAPARVDLLPEGGEQWARRGLDVVEVALPGGKHPRL